MRPVILVILVLSACRGDDSKPSGESGPDTGPDTAILDDPCFSAQGDPTFDSYGGDTRLDLGAEGFFRVGQSCDRWWFVTPEGHPFWSAGVNHVTPYGDTGRLTGTTVYADTVAATYADQDAWADATVQRLRAWGFNTAGDWSDVALMLPRMPYTLGVNLSGCDWTSGTVADWWDPAWEEAVDATTAGLAAYAKEPNLIGYFMDNEIRWGPDHRGNETLLQLYLTRGPESPGKAVAVALLVSATGDLDALNRLLGTAYPDEEALLAATTGWEALDPGSSETADQLNTDFLTLAADRYFSTAAASIRAADPNHLILGNREISIMTRPEVFVEAAKSVDVLSINNYVFFDAVVSAGLAISGALDPVDGFTALHDVVEAPIMITEFGFRAADSGLPNSYPFIYPTLETQEDRADAFEDYALDKIEKPWIVGYHWFEWVDQPMEGRFDGEDNNWGLVSETDEPYTTVTERTALVNATVWSELEIMGD